jgi:uncharacterized membrane protein YcaP (DUF421 family)
MWFHGWAPLLRVVGIAAAVYVLVIVVLRIVGERALAKMSAYDLIVTVALGSLVASIPLDSTISFLDGAAAILTFLLLQELTRWGQARWRVVHHVVREKPRLVVWDGEMLPDRLQKIAVTPDEVRGAIRRSGLYSLADVLAVILENDGDWSVIQRGSRDDLSALEGLDLPQELPSGASGDRWRERIQPGTANEPHRNARRSVVSAVAVDSRFCYFWVRCTTDAA